jgi:phosphoglycolate phosphatase
MLPPFDALLFDFDGTLAVLNLDFDHMRHRLLALAVAQGLPLDELQGMYILEMVDHATAILRQRHPDQAVTFHAKAHQLLREIEIEAAYSSTLLPGVNELLHALQRRAIGVGVVTRNCDAAVRIMFPHIDRYCQAFLARDHVEQVKPHPTHLQTALARLGSSPARTIMVGDGALDIQAGKALGMFTVGVLSGTGTRDRLRSQGADLVLDSAPDLLAYLPDHQGSLR